MKTLVTGGAGFLGAHLCLRLLNDGHEVTCIDDLSTGTKDNLWEHRDWGNFRFYEADVRQYSDDAEYHRIYHLACPASPPEYQMDPIKTLETSFLGAMRVSEMAATGARVLFTSTSEVYGNPDEGNHPQSEHYTGNVKTTGIRSCYDEGKRVSESYFWEAHRQHGFPLRIVRLFNTYGPYMRRDDGRVVSNFICQALQGEELTVYGLGDQTRALCYVDDMISALVETMEHGANYIGPMNLGNPQEISVIDIATLIIELTGSKSTIRHLPMPPDDPCRRCPDIRLAKKTLTWRPTTKLDKGLKLTIDWFRALLKKK